MVARCRIFVLALATVAVAARGLWACDSTGCLLQTRGQGVLPKGSWLFDVSLRDTDDSAGLRGSHPTDAVLRPKVYFEQQRLIPFFHLDRNERERSLQVDVGYGLFQRTTLFASVPAASQRSEDVSHGPVRTSYDVWGVGDGLIGVRQALSARGALVGSLALKAPLGRSGIVDSYDGTILEPTFQPGSGAWDVVSSLQYSFGAFFHDVAWTASASHELTTANARGYRFGNDAIATLGASRPLGGVVTASVQAKLFHKGRSRYLERDVASTGATLAYLTPGLRVRAPMRVGVYAFYQVPVYRYVNETQLGPRRAWLVGVNRAF